MVRQLHHPPVQVLPVENLLPVSRRLTPSQQWQQQQNRFLHPAITSKTELAILRARPIIAEILF
jgi:hypothetical protein